jgi:hypothetical protein
MGVRRRAEQLARIPLRVAIRARTLRPLTPHLFGGVVGEERLDSGRVARSI